MRAHITDSVKAAIKKTNSIPAVIPGGTTKYLQPLDISVKAWMTSGEKSFTKTGRMRGAPFSDVCQWILTTWSNVKESTITKGFRKAGLLCEESSAPSEATLPRDDSDMESDTDRETEESSTTSEATLPRDEGDRSNTNRDTKMVCDDAFLRLFNSDTEEDNFSGFSAQEEDD